MLCLHREPGKYIIYKIRSSCKVVIRILFLKTALLETEHSFGTTGYSVNAVKWLGK